MTAPTISRNPWPWILLVSAGVTGFLIWLIYGRVPTASGASWVTLLPAVNALFNTLSAGCLIGGFINIRRGNRNIHMRCMLSAVVFSTLFLISYIVYHHFHGDTPFPGYGLVRPVYFFILISHIGLSIVALPLVFSTLYYAATGQFQTHRKLARYTFPIWLYVSVTGVAVFCFLKVYS